MCYFNPSASSVVFNPLLFSRGVIFTFFAMVFSIRLASNAVFLSVQVTRELMRQAQCKLAYKLPSAAYLMQR